MKKVLVYFIIGLFFINCRGQNKEFNDYISNFHEIRLPSLIDRRYSINNTIEILQNIPSNDSIDTSCCHADIILRNRQVSIPIFNNLKHKDTLNFIIDDTLKEEYFSGVLFKIKGKYAYIKGQYMGYGYTYEGWIMKKYIATNLILLDSIPLYKTPKLKAIKTYIIDPKWYPVEILKCRDGCLYIKYHDLRQKIKGWLSPKYQCANPYTTCC